MFDVGIPELIMVLVVALIVFGPGKLPEVGANLGKAIRDFRKATQGISDEINAVTNFEADDEKTTREIMAQKAKEDAAATVAADPVVAAAVEPVVEAPSVVVEPVAEAASVTAEPVAAVVPALAVTETQG